MQARHGSENLEAKHEGSQGMSKARIHLKQDWRAVIFMLAGEGKEEGR